MLTRRSVLAFLGSLPFLGSIKPNEETPTAEVKTRESHPYREAADLDPILDGLVKDYSVEEMTEILWANLTTYHDHPTCRDKPWTEYERVSHRLVCEAFCRNLRNWELSEQYSLGQFNPDVTRFDVFQGAPVGLFLIGKNEEPQCLTAMTRKVQCMWSQEAAEAVRSCNWTPERAARDLAESIGQDAALEVQREIRQDAMNDTQPDVFAIYLPPWLGTPLTIPEDFSIDRRWRIRYAKRAV